MPERTPDASLSASDLQAILDLGDDSVIASALRLIEIQLRRGGLPNDARTPERLRLGRRRWPQVRARLLEVFEIQDGRWIHPALAARQAARARATAARSRRARDGWARRKAGQAPATPRQGATGPARSGAAPQDGKAAPPQQAAATPAAGPPPATAPEPPSVKKTVFDRGVAVLERANVPHRQARALLGRLCRDHGEDAVMLAISKSEKHAPVEPSAYIRKMAERYHAPAASRQPAPSSKPANPLATPATMGLSDGLVRRIRETARHDPGYVFTPKPGPSSRKRVRKTS